MLKCFTAGGNYSVSIDIPVLVQQVFSADHLHTRESRQAYCPFAHRAIVAHFQSVTVIHGDRFLMDSRTQLPECHSVSFTSNSSRKPVGVYSKPLEKLLQMQQGKTSNIFITSLLWQFLLVLVALHFGSSSLGYFVI